MNYVCDSFAQLLNNLGNYFTTNDVCRYFSLYFILYLTKIVYYIDVKLENIHV